MIGCIYHEADLDGVMSAAIVKNLKSATKLFSVLLASKRPLITELADKLRLKYPLLPTISPHPVSERRLVSLRGNIFSMISKPLTW